MTKRLNDILTGAKSSKTESPDLKKVYQWNGKDGEKFISKHKIEKHEDRVGNGDDVYKGNTKKANYKRQSDEVYESIQYDRSKPDENITHYNIVNHKTGKVVGKAKTKVGARKSIDNNDNKYGGYAHKAVAVYKEEVEDIEEKYEGFKKLKGELADKGAKTPSALAAWIGRKKYGKEKFQKAAASDHKMKEDKSCDCNSKKKMLLDKEVKEDSTTPNNSEKNPFSSTTGSNNGRETTPKKETDTTPKSLSKITKEDVEHLDEISREKALNYVKSATNRASEIDKEVPYRTKRNAEKYDDSRKEKSKRLAGAKLAADKFYKKARVPATEDVEIQETAPPNPKIEKWIKANKGRFVKEYGKEKGMEVLYAKAWKMHNESSPATTTDYAGPGAAGWTTGRMDTGTL